MASGKVVRYFLETTNTDDPRSGNRVVTEERREYGNKNTARYGDVQNLRYAQQSGRPAERSAEASSKQQVERCDRGEDTGEETQTCTRIRKQVL